MTINQSTMMSDLGQRIAKARDEKLCEQLSWFVKRGLLVVEQGPMQFIQEVDSMEIRIVQIVELQLKDKEYIEKLEEENKMLKQSFDFLKSVMVVP